MQFRKILLLAMLFSSIAVTNLGCSKGPLKIYKRDLQQGNYVTQSMVNKLRADLTKSQVREVMGSPTLVSTFHKDRWHYHYSFKAGDGSLTEAKDLTLYFKKNFLKAYSGDWTIKKLPKKKK